MENPNRTPARTQGKSSGTGGKGPPEEPSAHEIGDDDDGFECRGDLPVLIPEGDYEFGFVRAEKANIYTRTKVYLWMQITTPGDHFGKRLWVASNVPPTHRWGASCKYWQMWVLAAARRPGRHDRLVVSVFKDKIFVGRVVTVKTMVIKKDGKNVHVPRAPEMYYSKIDRLLQLRAGGAKF